MADKPLKVYRGQWPETIVCGASGTGRTRFAYALAARYNGHVVDTGDALASVRAVSDAEQSPEFFAEDAEEWLHRFLVDDSIEPLTGTPEELAATRFRVADALAPAAKAVQLQQPRLHLDGFNETPHTVITGRHALPALAFDFVVILMENEEQIRANLASRASRSTPDETFLGLRVQTSMKVQEELVRRGGEHNKGHCRVIYLSARPWEDAVERAYSEMDDYWDYSTALGGMW